MISNIFFSNKNNWSNVLVILLLFLIELSIACSGSKHCGNQINSYCEFSNFNIFPGIGYDNHQDKVFLLGRFNQSSELKYIVSLNGDGSSSLSGVFSVLTDSFSSTHITQEMFYYDEEIKLPVLTAMNRGFYSYGPYFPKNNTFLPYWTTQYYPLAVYFDDIDSSTYLVNNYLQRIVKNITVEMIQFPVVGIRHIQSMKRVDKSCVDCTQIENVLTLPFTTFAFERSSTHFYFGVTIGYFGSPSDQPGLYQLPINGPISKLRKILDNPVQGLVFNSDKSSLFVSTYDNQVFRINQLSGNHQVLSLYTHSSNEGACLCTSRFSGKDCKECFSDNIVMNNGVAACVFKSPDQYKPCFADSQCGNLSMSYCEGFCKCKNGFEGVDCSVCTGTITWDYSVPKCTPKKIDPPVDTNTQTSPSQPSNSTAIPTSPVVPSNSTTSDLNTNNNLTNSSQPPTSTQ
ncbi:hypothetical protein PPL_00534 [Heterostelium album PN500]|uniref:EGF-like domain-containing protein n=1 Tax=Heterostelium pallidum (strain ATCC 26659 / Pp 5 / PN500) TaxID=670386 RepID=D3AWQ6_HETP5|nr:hypothetical protein PPL_00534 [Heterostelium album PN500]EFA86729.1 hypothetical protein PPL_00534 [Heterostelium album PN500]|eukprot:XP_020438833.1 hypothetical protein PPL_00534 [Heterostelium album PN500]